MRDLISVTAQIVGPRVPLSRPQIIMREVERAHGISHHDLISKRRFKHLVRARREIIVRMRDELKLSKPRIGRWLGGLDHTTVHYHYRLAKTGVGRVR